MWKQLAILSTLFLTQLNISLLYSSHNMELISADTSCKREFDSLTKKMIYTSADILPSYEGGNGALSKKLERGINTDIEFPSDFDGRVTVAFIIDVDGSIKGERIIKDKTNKVGQQMLDIAKTFKWTPAICKAKKIAMLYTLTSFVDLVEN